MRLKSSYVASLFLLLFSIAITAPVEAKPPHHPPLHHPAEHGFDCGGYTGPGPAAVSVKEALAKADDGEWVVLRGKITQSLGGKEYLFADQSGSIKVHIGPHEWNGQKIGPDDMLEVQGKMHREWLDDHIHIKQIIKQ